MPQTYYDFDPWRRAADNIASGMVAVAQAKNRKAMFDAEMQQRAPLVEAQTESANAQAAKYRGDAARSQGQTAALTRVGKFFSENVEVDQESGAMRLRPGADWGQVLGDIAESSRGGNDAALATGNFAKTLQRPGEEKAKLTNRKEIKQMELDASAKKPIRMSPGSALLDPESLEVRYSQPSAASQQKGDSLPVGVKQSLETLGKEWAMAIAEGKMEDADRIAASVRATREKYATGQNNSLTPAPSGVNTPVTNAVPTLRIVRGPDGKPMFVQ